MILTEEHYKGAEQIFKKILQQRKEELEEEDSCD